MFTIVQKKSIRIDKLFLRAASRVATLSVLLALTVSCIGISNVPVIYHVPVEGQKFTSAAEFLPWVEFPNGLPAQENVSIRLNGSDITADFDQWSGNDARVTAVNDVDTPLIWAALRDGRNTFQVFNPNKSLVTFNLDFPTAKVHISSVEDGWDGFVTTPKPDNLRVTGYIEGSDYANLKSIRVQSLILPDVSNTPIEDNGVEGRDMTAVPGQTVTEGAGAYHLTLNNDFTFDFKLYDADADADAVRITITKTINGVDHATAKTWLRSNIPLQRQRTGGDALSVALDQVALMSTGLLIGNLIDAQPLVTPANPVIHSECLLRALACLARVDIEVYDLITQNSAIDLSVLPEERPDSSRFFLDAKLPIKKLSGSIQISFVECQFQDGQVDFSSNVTLSADAAGVTSVGFDSTSVNVGSILQGACEDVVSFFEDLLIGLIEPVIASVVGGVMNSDLPRTRMVLRYGNEIVPPTYTRCFGEPPSCDRMGDVYDPGVYDFGAYILGLGAKTGGFYQRKNPWVSGGGTAWDYAWGLNLGFHVKGTGSNRLPSIGSFYQPFAIENAKLAFGDTPQEQQLNARTLGASVSENFVNQLMMGLWESNILYIDLGFGEISSPNPLLDDVKFVFASDSPWEVQVLDSDDPKGDLLVRIPDLTVAFVGDIHYPEFKDDYEFAYMYADLEIYLNVGVAQSGGALRVGFASAVEVTVNAISSDWGGITAEDMIVLFDLALNYLTGFGALDIPIPDIVGTAVDFGNVWTKPGQLYATIDLYNREVFPKHPDTKLMGFSSWKGVDFLNMTPSNGDIYSLDNNVDDTGTASFHAAAVRKTRSYTRDQLNCIDWHTHDEYYGTSEHCHAYAYTDYYWTEDAIDYGFGVRFLRLSEITEIRLDGRDDCCTDKMNGVEVHTRNEETGVTTYQHTISGFTADGYTISLPPGTIADALVFYAPIDTSAPYYNAPLQSDPGGAASQMGNGIRRIGSGDNVTMNFTEITLKVK